ncbi:hypothetical protein [Methanosarcina sp. Kolksee]|uniref:hypothetical protein n=1 Tax=Methanosarcina sp. Kolksee TaxID=1434099 RepID=UPI0012E01E3A|nr:hypothetical protein [Methanosarcina sp. Kolksee]
MSEKYFMDDLELIKPTTTLEEAALEYKKEHFDIGEYELHGSALLDKIDLGSSLFCVDILIILS